jgi:ribosomal protein S6
MESELRSDYELGYHVTMDVEEGRAAEVKDDLEAWVTKAGCAITFSQPPERRHLSYPIKHQNQAYFGWLQFTLTDREKLTELDEHLRHYTDILRYVLLRLDPEEDKRTAPLAASRERKAAAEAAKPRTVEEKPAEDKGKLEEQLSEALEGIE